MTDRELLELAALATGITLEWDGRLDRWQPMYYENKAYHLFDPINDDAQALRIAVKLCMSVLIGQGGTIAVYINGDATKSVSVVNNYLPDGNAATRRAIVRAAAEIGKEMI